MTDTSLLIISRIRELAGKEPDMDSGVLQGFGSMFAMQKLVMGRARIFEASNVYQAVHEPDIDRLFDPDARVPGFACETRPQEEEA
jgi:hypothetical protein